MKQALLILVMVTNLVFAAEQQCSKTAAALTACQNYVQALEQKGAVQDEKIKLLIAQRSEVQEQLGEATAPPLVPTWLFFALGVGLGGALAFHLK